MRPSLMMLLPILTNGAMNFGSGAPNRRVLVSLAAAWVNSPPLPIKVWLVA